jgi:hypothetical protein
VKHAEAARNKHNSSTEASDGERSPAEFCRIGRFLVVIQKQDRIVARLLQKAEMREADRDASPIDRAVRSRHPFYGSG